MLTTIIGTIGAIASVVGAIFAVRAKIKAESSAERALEAKNSIIKKQDTTNLAQILSEAKRVQNVFSKYSIAQSNRSLSGVKFEDDAKELQQYIFNFNENRAIIEKASDIKTEVVYTELNEFLDEFSNSNKTDVKKDFGKQIKLSISDIIFKLKKEIDKRNSEYN